MSYRIKITTFDKNGDAVGFEFEASELEYFEATTREMLSQLLGWDCQLSQKQAEELFKKSTIHPWFPAQKDN